MLSWFPAAFRHAGICFLDHPVPAGEFSVPHGRPAGHDAAAGPRRGSHVPLVRDTAREGALYTPGDDGVHAAGQVPPAAACRFTTASPLHPGDTAHHPELTLTRRHQEFTHVHPSGLLLACGPQMGQGPLGFEP